MVLMTFNRKVRLNSIFLWIFSICYFVILVYVVFGARRRIGVSADFMRSYLNLVPLRDNLETLFSDRKLSHSEIFNFYENVIGNILMFIPLPIILIFLFGNRKNLRAIGISVLISVAIELLQFAFGVGVADIDDVLLNSLGAVVGVWICTLLASIFRKSVLKPNPL